METRFKKTDAGQREVSNKALGLAPRVRSVLIMVDGQRDRSQLRAMLGAGADEALSQLLAQGLIVELAPVAAAPLAAATSPAAPAVPAAAAARGREAARAVTDLLGPEGDRLALLLERADSPESLLAALQQTAAVLDAVAPRAGAQAFRQRFLG